MMAAIWVLRISVALTMVIFGIHQFLNPREWIHYIPKFLQNLSPVSLETDMRAHSLGNMAFGLFLIAGNFHPLLAAWVALIWWITILPFAFQVKWDIGLRDLTIIGALIALVILLS